jgi:hypothetical protein
MVDADTQYLGTIRFELGQVGLVRRYLVRSNRGPGQWEEGEQDVMFAAVFTEPDPVVHVAGKLEIGGSHANFYFHARPPHGYCIFSSIVS